MVYIKNQGTLEETSLINSLMETHIAASHTWSGQLTGKLLKRSKPLPSGNFCSFFYPVFLVDPLTALFGILLLTPQFNALVHPMVNEYGLCVPYCAIKIVRNFDLTVNSLSWSTLQDTGPLLCVLITHFAHGGWGYMNVHWGQP